MLNVIVTGKAIDTTEIRKLFVQGEKSALHICFLVPTQYTGLSWSIRGSNEQAGTLAEQLLTATDGATNVAVEWEPDSDFCASGGQLHLTLVGTDALGDIVAKAVGDVEVQRDSSMDGHTPVSEDLYEQLIAEARECVDDAEAAQAAAEAAQTAAELSATAAGNSATAAGNSETAAEAAQAAAEAAQTAAELSATAAGNSATAADASATAADNSATEAEASAIAAAQTLENAVQVTEQDFNDAQKGQARENIDVYSKSETEEVVIQAVGGNDALFVAMLSGTPENYIAVMRAWFNANGAAARVEFSELLDRWYTITRIGWNGGVSFPAPSVSDISNGVKTGDNFGMSCSPSTNTVASQDDYAGNPLFACVDCNWTLDADGKPLIQAIDGVCGAFDRFSQEKPVGVLQMAGFIKYEQTAENVNYLYSDEWNKLGYYPLPEAVNLDDTVRTWVVHGKYAMGDDYGCYSGVAPAAWTISHNSMLTGVRAAWSNQYCGKTSADDAFMKIMWWIKYASWTMDDIMNGCCNYYYNTYTPAIAETGVERIILTDAQAANLLVGSTVCLGSTSYGTYAAQCSVVDRKKITSIESIGGGHTALNIDNGGVTFNTTTSLLLSTMQWYTGSCDDVLGNDGSPSSNTSGKEICKLQGIEFRFGANEIICDTIVQYFSDGANKMRMCTCRDASKLSTGITADYVATSYSIACPASSGSNYLKEMGNDPDLPEVIAPKQIGGSSATYMRDAFYILAASSGECEWRSLGVVSSGSAYAGLSGGDGYVALTGTTWAASSRLSSTGNRGTYSA